MRPHLGPFADQGHIAIASAALGLPTAWHGPGKSCSAPSMRIRRRKMPTNVASASAIDCVGQGASRHRHRNGPEGPAMRHLHATQPRHRRRKRMNIKAIAQPQIHLPPSRSPRPWRNRRDSQFQIIVVARHDGHIQTIGLPRRHHLPPAALARCAARIGSNRKPRRLGAKVRRAPPCPQPTLARHATRHHHHQRRCCAIGVIKRCNHPINHRRRN